MPTGAGSALESLQCTLPAGDSTSEQLNTLTCSGRVLATGSMDNYDDRTYAAARCASAGVTGSCCSYHLFGEGAWFLTDGEPVAQGGVPDEASWGRSAGTCAGQAPAPAPGPLQCTLPAGDSTSEQLNTLACSGRVLATGSMDNYDDRTYAAARCASAGVTGSCCSYHLFGEGAWFLTDGEPVAQGGVPDETSWGRSAGTCAGQAPAPAPGPLQCTLPAGDSTSEQLNTLACSGRVLATGSMDNYDDRTYAAARCASAGVTGSCCSYHLFGEGAWFLTDGEPVAQGGVPDETSWGRSAGTCTGQ